MRIKLPSRNPLRKLMLGAFGLLLLCIVVTVVVAFIHGGEMWLLPVWVGAIGLVAMLPLLIVLWPFMSKAEINRYKYIEFTESYVILAHKDPALTRNLPYDQTDLSLTFFTETFVYRRTYHYVSRIMLSFTQEENLSIELKGSWTANHKFIRQLLDNAKRFKHFEFTVLPDPTRRKQICPSLCDEDYDKKQQEFAFYFEKAITRYLSGTTTISFLTPIQQKESRLWLFAIAMGMGAAIIGNYCIEGNPVGPELIFILVLVLLVFFIYRYRAKKRVQELDALHQTQLTANTKNTARTKK